METGSPSTGRRRTPPCQIKPVRAPLLPSPKEKESREPGDGQARPVAAPRSRHARSGSRCEPGSADLFHNFPRRPTGARRTHLPAAPSGAPGPAAPSGARSVCRKLKSGYFSETQCVPSPQFSPIPVPQRRGPQGWGRRRVYPAASHSAGLMHQAKRRLLHSKWWSLLLPPSLSSRAGLAQRLSWPLQPLHSRSVCKRS